MVQGLHGVGWIPQGETDRPGIHTGRALHGHPRRDSNIKPWIIIPRRQPGRIEQSVFPIGGGRDTSTWRIRRSTIVRARFAKNISNSSSDTEWSVRDTDGTVVFTMAKEVTGGSLRTVEFARKHKKPCFHISKSSGNYTDPALKHQRFVSEHGIKRLNVAGSRGSKEPDLHRWVMKVLEDAFFWSEVHGCQLGGPGEG